MTRMQRLLSSHLDPYLERPVDERLLLELEYETLCFLYREYADNSDLVKLDGKFSLEYVLEPKQGHAMIKYGNLFTFIVMMDKRIHWSEIDEINEKNKYVCPETGTMYSVQNGAGIITKRSRIKLDLGF